jgi:hypothetical protein
MPTNVVGATARPGSGAQRCAQAGEREHRTGSTAGTATATAAAKTRHYCRNPRCRMKLPVPVENGHHAFCTPGCHTSFYRSRCLVCEDPMRRRREGQRIKSGHGKCSAEYRRFPRVYDLPQRSDVPMVGISNVSLAEAHFTGTFSGPIGERPHHRGLRHWSWSSDELEHEVRDAAGTLLARLESNAGRHRLTCPRTTPILSWSALDEAKRHAESFALMAMPLAAADPKLATRIERDNETPHPMGSPLDRPPLTSDAIWSDWRPTGNGAGVPDIPDFLRRRP